MSFLDRWLGRREEKLPAAAPASETDPLDRFRAGEEGAFEELMDGFAPSVVRLFRRHGVDSSTAEDLAQEVFVRLLRTRAHYEGRGKLQVYLYRIARNVWRDWQRATATRPVARSLDAPPSASEVSLARMLAHPAVGPAEALASSDASRAMARLMLRLSEGERLVLELALFESLPYAEISEALGIPEGTVKSRVFHALRKLRVWSSGAEEVRR
ncbi:MAG: sigma-70 family RNA polymerase sigma factor [Planctomycetes bacterium]|nr:sigma-70 family RNA polymerase sigma factor [Planctomycetota bacterium]